MNWTAKNRASSTTPAVRSKPSGGSSGSAASPSANLRISNGLKEFLQHLEDEKTPRILDLGQVSQATLNFFIEKGYRVTTEDSLRSWKEFLSAEEEGLRLSAVGHGPQQ